MLIRVGAACAEIIEKHFTPEVPARDVVALPNYHLHFNLMADGVVARPFDAETIALG
ncbi:MAG TPA: hypothetical protein VLH75_18060 [Longimicrobiales bacterium]|nr:hypothetical protein [Longimicrobiales bacterium]